MQLHIFSIGKPKLGFAKLGVEEYAARLKPFVSIKLNYLKGGSLGDESRVLLDRSAGMFRVAMDERGAQVSSRSLAQKIGNWELRATRNMAILIGGADGHTEEVRQKADWVWSLSPLTLQHELALVVVLEQIYRAYTIKAGLPYHRD